MLAQVSIPLWLPILIGIGAAIAVVLLLIQSYTKKLGFLDLPGVRVKPLDFPVDALPHAAALVGSDGSLLTCNDLWREYNNRAMTLWQLPVDVGDRLPIDSRDEVLLTMVKQIEDQVYPILPIEFNPTDSPIPDTRMRLSGKPLEGVDGQYLLLLEDISISSDKQPAAVRVQQLMSVTPDLMCYIDGDYKFRSFNQLWLDFHNLRVSQAIGKTVGSVLGEAFFRDTLKDNVDRAFAGEILEFESHYEYPNGKQAYLDVRYLPQYGESGQVEGVAALARDITKERVAEQKLIKKESELNSTMDSLMEGVAVHDSNGVIIECNRAAELICNKSREDIVGSRSIIEHTQVRDEHGRVLSLDELPSVKALRTGEPQYNVTLGTIDGKGNEVWMLVTAIPVVDPIDNSVSTVVTSFYDTSELRRIKENQQSLERELSQSRKLEALGHLTGGIAHDFNNILAVILGFTELLTNPDIAPSQRDQYLQHIDDTIKRGTQMVSQLLTYSRDQDEASSTVDLANSVTEDLALLELMLPAGIEVKTEMDRNLPKVRIDRGQLNQLLMNLTINAGEAMKQQGVLIFEVGMRRIQRAVCHASYQEFSGEFVELTIRDSGSGIKPDIIDKVFDPYFTTADFGRGTGLGLSVVSGVLRGCSAFVLIETELGEGTAFHLLFPPETINPTFPDAQNTPKYTPKESQGERVLVVDDEVFICEFLTDLLTLHGYQVESTHSALEAKQWLTDKPFDALLTDYSMPKLNGHQLIQHARGVDAQIVAIMCTGNILQPVGDAAISEGFVVLQKPIEQKIVLDALRLALDEKAES